MQEILRKMPDAKIKVMVAWTPLLAHDNKAAAQRATAYLTDSRVGHFWDLWAYANKTYAKQFGLPTEEAWDLLAVYRSYLSWGDSLPEPTFWMQRRNLKTGTPYDKDQLEERLRALVK